jgi:phage terminase Nu1 subunit (DNA packaging protein)
MTQQTYSFAAKGYLTRIQLAAELEMKPDTVLRWEHAGMPCIKYGQLALYEVESVVNWLKRQNNKKP